jgi:hypothetical protein
MIVRGLSYRQAPPSRCQAPGARDARAVLASLLAAFSLLACSAEEDRRPGTRNPEEASGRTAGARSPVTGKSMGSRRSGRVAACPSSGPC